MTITLLVVDTVGVLLPDGRTRSRLGIERAVGEAGLVPRPGALDQVLGHPEREAIRLLLEGHGRDDRLGELDRLAGLAEATMLAADLPVPDEALLAAFAALGARGIRIAALGGIGEPAHRTLLERLLNNAGWTPDLTAAPREGLRPRPHPDLLRDLAARAGVAMEATAFLGDRPIHLQEGTMARAGLVLGWAPRADLRPPLMEQPHHAIVMRPSDLLPLFPP